MKRPRANQGRHFYYSASVFRHRASGMLRLHERSLGRKKISRTAASAVSRDHFLVF
jgi:hypothetical protein